MTTDGTMELRRADPCILVIFGASGDLTKRKLIPALYNLARAGLMSESFAVVGCARTTLSSEKFRQQMSAAAREFSARPFDDGLWETIAKRLHYLAGDPADPATYTQLKTKLAEMEGTYRIPGNYLFYLATPPMLFTEIGQHLCRAGLSRAEAADRGWRRIVIEKPFGRDLQSARVLNRSLQECFDESQIYRIDHYLGKETVQNVIVFRFANGIFEPIWNRRYIDHVQITAAETVGIEGRGRYYQHAGALRDMVQTHLFQLLALVAMEPPASFDADAVRDKKVEVLEAVQRMTAWEIMQRTVRGQYGEGTIEGKRCVAYRSEPDVAPDSATETYAALKLFVENWRWADVPFYLRSGKRMARRDTEIVIQFRRVPVLLFRHANSGVLEPNRLVIHIQPDERIEVQFQAKRPGPSVRPVPAQIEFCYSSLGETTLSTGYETLLYDVTNGDGTLFHRSDMVEAAWQVADPILDAWQASPAADFPNYAAGTQGPEAACDLIERDGRRWLDPA